MNVALCLIGHIRNFETTNQSQINHVINKLNCDVFIDTSTENSNPLFNIKEGKSTRHSWKEDKEKIENIIKKVLDSKVKKLSIEEPTEINPGFVRHKQWERLANCLQMIEEYEKEVDKTYNMIIKSRFDLKFPNAIPNLILDEKSIFGCKHFDSDLKMYDQFFLGSRKIMMKFKDFPKMYKKDGKSEKELIKFLSQEKIEISWIPEKFGMSMIR